MDAVKHFQDNWNIDASDFAEMLSRAFAKHVNLLDVGVARPLYERFLLEYFKRHHQEFNPRSSKIEWDSEDISSNMPGMNSDVYLTYGEKYL